MPEQVDDDRVLVEVPAWSAELFHPAGRAGVILAVVCLGGFVALPFAWREVAATIFVPFQTPWLVSAGMAGVAVAVTSLALLGIHLERRAAAERRADIDELTRSLNETSDALAHWLESRRAPRPRPVKRARRAAARPKAKRSTASAG